jgi:3-phosphoshikimate 1-carboxyvinyltransferase
MPDIINIQPAAGPIQSTIRPPGSKSITNRALPLAALAAGRSVLTGVLNSDDTQYMIESLRRLGIQIETDWDRDRVTVDGCGGQFPNSSAELFIGNSGTTIRFLTAILGFHGGTFRLEGIDRMHERPIGALVEALVQIEANVKAESAGDCPPVSIESDRAGGGTIKVKGNVSSQYLSGLLMAAPLASGGITIEIDGPLISKPYVTMTIEVMKSFGVQVQSNESLSHFQIAGDQAYAANDYQIEPDASAASYFWGAAAICGGTATVQGLGRDSLQGDVGFVDCMQQMGCEVTWAADGITVAGPATIGIDIDMSNVSDTVQTLASVALFVDGSTTVRNVAHNRVKETDRIGNLAIELRKFGAKVDEHPDGLTIHPRPLGPATIETYDDHRMAMSLALVGLNQSGVEILDPGCVAKTYPNYFADLQKFVSVSDESSNA